MPGAGVVLSPADSLEAKTTQLGGAEPVEHGCVAFSNDGSNIGTGSNDGTARVWAVSTGQPVAKPMTNGVPGTEVIAAQFSPSFRSNCGRFRKR